MKLQQNTNTVVRSGSFEESNYTIEASAKAFSILSDGLYANKVKAVVRELSTNAYDAHIDAGCPDRPFDVHLPNRMELHFSIRDYGTGLSHEDCMNLYTTYFGSNKTDSNDAVGCLGLGSKSPFAYTDSFTVISCHNGTKRVYNAYKNEHDQPVFAMLDELETDESNGMEVIFPVKDDDRHDFESEAQDVYRHFKVKPNVSGNDIVFEDVEYIIEGDYWGVQKRHGYAVAIMGQVEYPIDEDQFDGTIYDILTSSVNIHFKIGELDITPSREALSYNQYTKDALTVKVESMLAEIKEVLSTSFDACESLWDARVKYCELSDHGNLLNRLTGVFDKAELTWKDKPLWEAGGWSMAHKIPEGMTMKHVRREDWKSTISCTDSDRMHFSTRKEKHIFIDDLKRGGIGRTKEFVATMVNMNRHGDNNHEAHLFRDTTIESICEALGCTPSIIKKTSDLPSVTQAKSRRGASTGSVTVRSKVCVWDAEYKQWRDVEIDMSEGGYYVEIFRYDVVVDGQRHSSITPTKLIAHIKKHTSDSAMIEDLTGTPIYGIKSAEFKRKRFNLDEQWMSLIELAKTIVMSKYLDDIESWVKQYIAWNETSVDGGKKLVEILTHCSAAPQELVDYANEYEIQSGRKTIVQDWIQACYVLGICTKHIDEDKCSIDWEKKHEEILNGLPLLKMYLENRDHSYWDDEEYVELGKYIDMIGERNEN